MATISTSSSVDALPKVQRRLFLIWQHPDTHQFIRVGQLSELIDGRYVFEYTDGAEVDGFHPLVEFPERDHTYVADVLPAFFVNRLMSTRRPSYPEYLGAVGIDSPQLATPMELMARTGAPRATDTFHLVDDLQPNPDGRVVSRFLVSGVRHIDGADDVLRQLRPGDHLSLRAEPDNPQNARAQLICTSTGHAVGYLPDWMLEDVDELRRRAVEFEVLVERVSPEMHPHLRLLCRIDAKVQ